MLVLNSIIRRTAVFTDSACYEGLQSLSVVQLVEDRHPRQWTSALLRSRCSSCCPCYCLNRCPSYCLSRCFSCCFSCCSSCCPSYCLSRCFSCCSSCCPRAVGRRRLEAASCRKASHRL